MHADVGGDAAGLLIKALPRRVIPSAARGEIAKVHVVDFILGAIRDLFFQRDNGMVQTQLQDRVNAFARLFFQSGKVINVGGVQHQRLFANRIRACAQRKAHVGFM